MEFYVSGAAESLEENPDRTWEPLLTVKSLGKAERAARRFSGLRKWHEVKIKGVNENNELICHSYWRNGKLETDMLL